MHNRKGFTLVELLVAAALFATVVVIAVNIFILTLRRPLQEIDNQHVQEEISYLFEALAFQVRSNQLDYTQYTTITNPVAELYLVDLDGSSDQVRLYLSSGQVWLELITTGVSYPVTTVSSNDVSIDSLQFFIYPQTDPSDPSVGDNYQPAVVMYVAGHSVKDPTVTFSAQTLMTFRAYVR